MSDAAESEGQTTTTVALAAGAAPRARAGHAGPNTWTAASASALNEASEVLRGLGGAGEGRAARRTRQESGAPPLVDTKQKALHAICSSAHLPSAVGTTPTPDADHSIQGVVPSIMGHHSNGAIKCP